jgi:hypothetical protein
VLLGLVRMLAANKYLQASASTNPWVLMVLEACLLLVACLITFKAYSRTSH